MIAPNVYAAAFVIELIQAWGTPALVAGLLGTGGLGALVPAIIAWRKAPVERKDADIAAADAAQGMSLKLAQELRTELARMGDRISTLETKLDKETTRREALEVEVRDARDVNYRLRVILARAQDSIEYIVTHWPTVRLKETPPTFPSLIIDD